MAIDKPVADTKIYSSWGISVANAINRIGVGMLRAWSDDIEVGPGATVILPFQGVDHDARVFFHPEDGSVRISEGRRGVYVVTAFLSIRSLPDDQWARCYLYRNGIAFAGSSIVGAGGTGVPVNIAGIDAFEEGDTVQVRVNVQNLCTISLMGVSMTRIAENT